MTLRPLLVKVNGCIGNNGKNEESVLIIVYDSLSCEAVNLLARDVFRPLGACLTMWSDVSSGRRYGLTSFESLYSCRLARKPIATSIHHFKPT